MGGSAGDAGIARWRGGMIVRRWVKSCLGKLSTMNRVKRYWLCLYRISAQYGYGELFLKVSYHGLTKLFANPWLQKQLFPAKVELIEKFLVCTNSDRQAAQVLQQRLFETSLLGLRYQDAWLHFDAAKLDQYFVVEGWQRFAQAYQTGRGVLLALSHIGLPKVLIHYLKAHGYSGPAIRQQMRVRLQATGEEMSPLNRMLLSARDLAEANQSLASGGIAYILPDGKQGATTIAYPFWGRLRHFRTGFAELALTSGAVVLPAVCIPQLNGKFSIKFFEPFDLGTPAINRQERVELLVHQYADHLAQLWALAPGSLRTSDICQFLYESEEYDPPAPAESEQKPAWHRDVF